MLLRTLVVASCAAALALGRGYRTRTGGRQSGRRTAARHSPGIATTPDGPSLSAAELDLVTGEYYRLNVTSDGVEPWRSRSTTCCANSHLRIVTINGIEVHLQAMAFRAIEFDVAGTTPVQLHADPDRHVRGSPSATFPSVRRRRADGGRTVAGTFTVR